MKSKIALFLIASAMLASCNAPSPAQSSEPASEPPLSSEPFQPTYLNWIAEGKLVVDTFSIGQAQFTYGNAALSKATNTLDLSADAVFGASGNLTESEVFNFVFVAEGPGAYEFGVYKQITGDSLTEFCNLQKNAFKTAKYGYLAISGGTEVQWTKGKNAALDDKIQSAISSKN